MTMRMLMRVDRFLRAAICCRVRKLLVGKTLLSATQVPGKLLRRARTRVASAETHNRNVIGSAGGECGLLWLRSSGIQRLIRIGNRHLMATAQETVHQHIVI